MRHPSQVLFAGEKPFPMIPAVDHYAGSEKLINKALQLQNELGRSSTSPATARTVQRLAPTASMRRWSPS
jgi:hypothetical protein